jgi:mRNA interferase MazF
MVAQPSRGDVWSIKFDPTVGREQAGTRPAVVISVDRFNHGPADLIVVVPVTSKDKKQPIHVPVRPPEGGLQVLSFIKCEDVRSVSKERLKKFLGTLSPQTIAEIETRIRILLGL